MSTLDAPTQTPIDGVNIGEGLAYRPSTHELYMWDEDDTIVRNANTGAKVRQYPTSYSNEIEGASFYINPITQEEELWLIVEDLDGPGEDGYKNRYIQKVDIATGHVITNTRKKLIGGFMDSSIEYGNDIGSLAINPETKQFWITHDSNHRKLANIDPTTGQISNVQDLTPADKVDAEVLSFDDSGVMYTESDRNNLNERYLWKINPSTGHMSKATAQFGIAEDGDLEGMACNAGFSKVTPKATEPFTCNNEGIIFSADSLLSTTTNFSKVDLETGTYNFIQEFATRHINAAGYNVHDNFIYGIGFKNDENGQINVVKVDKEYNVETLNITGLPQGNSLYALGDVDFDNKLYVSTIQSANAQSFDYLKSLIVIDLDTKTVERETPLVFPADSNMTTIYAADYAFNPIDEMLYTIDSNLNQLIRINPISGQVELLGDVGSIGNVYSVISFFDLNGNFLFSNNDNSIIYKINISDPANVNAIATPYITGLSMPSSGDGAKCAYSRLPNKSILGTFNIERTNSGVDAINSDKRNAWYTQIVGRDFDYSVVFYDENVTTLKEIKNVTVKIDLVNQDTNQTLYTRYQHINADPAVNRVDFVPLIVSPEDLANIPATKRAIFRVSYGINSDGSIISSDCNTNPQICYESHVLTRTDDARDNFAIRPEKFYVSIADGTQERINTSSPTHVVFAAGYDYNLSVKATKLISTHPSYVPSEGYTGKVIRELKFDMNGDCANPEDINQSITFMNGLHKDINFSHNNVGKYILNIKDDNNWTSIDNNGNDCEANKSYTSEHFNEISGCNISQISDLKIHFQPDHFAVNLNMRNLPNSGHPEFIYMMRLDAINDNVAISFEGNITAQTEDNTTTSNFTAGCMASNVLLDLNTTTVSVEGSNQDIHTIAGTDVNFSRFIRFNADSSTPTTNLNQRLNRIARNINISKDKFLNGNSGSMTIDMRYNLNKHLTEPINPVQVRFNSIDVSSTDANSVAHDKINITSNIHTPRGTQAFVNNVKDFYFARVVSNLDNYPRVNLNIDPTVRTPLNVDIYCKTIIPNYCVNTNVTTHSSVTSTTREANGWYLSNEHNGTHDGNVTNLTADNPVMVTITPDANPSTAINILMLNKGSNGLVTETFNNCNNPSSTITIFTSPVLAFEPSQYTVKCTDINASQWTGIGQTGNVLSITPKVNKAGKMDW